MSYLRLNAQVIYSNWSIVDDEAKINKWKEQKIPSEWRRKHSFRIELKIARSVYSSVDVIFGITCHHHARITFSNLWRADIVQRVSKFCKDEKNRVASWPQRMETWLRCIEFRHADQKRWQDGCMWIFLGVRFYFTLEIMNVF